MSSSLKRQRSNSVCLEEKVAVVTGGTGVLGTAFCEGLAQEGAAVVVVGRRADVCEALAARLATEYGVPTLAAPADVLDQPSLFRARDKIVEKFGRIDVLVNGAGGNQKGATVAPEGSFFEVPRAAIENVFELNITGTMLATQIFGEVMAKRGAGSIINISSISSASPLTRVVGYSAAKAGVENFTKWLAVELARKHGASLPRPRWRSRARTHGRHRQQDPRERAPARLLPRGPEPRAPDEPGRVADRARPDDRRPHAARPLRRGAGADSRAHVPRVGPRVLRDRVDPLRRRRLLGLFRSLARRLAPESSPGLTK